MNTAIIALTSSPYGLSYQNAACLDDVTFVVRVDKTKLVANVPIQIALGYNGSQGHFPLQSELGIEFPVTAWTMTCTE